MTAAMTQSQWWQLALAATMQKEIHIRAHNFLVYFELLLKCNDRKWKCESKKKTQKDLFAIESKRWVEFYVSCAFVHADYAIMCTHLFHAHFFFSSPFFLVPLARCIGLFLFIIFCVSAFIIPKHISAICFVFVRFYSILSVARHHSRLFFVRLWFTSFCIAIDRILCARIHTKKPTVKKKNENDHTEMRHIQELINLFIGCHVMKSTPFAWNDVVEFIAFREMRQKYSIVMCTHNTVFHKRSLMCARAYARFDEIEK